MRFLAWIFVALVSLAWLATEIEAPPAAAREPAQHWRRTRHGWERISRWQAPRRPLHPGWIAGVQALAALAIWRGERRLHSLDRDSQRDTAAARRRSGSSA